MTVINNNTVLKQAQQNLNHYANNNIKAVISNSWEKIAPFWPLKNLVAVNPLAGFENLEFTTALKYAQAYFQPKHLPQAMQQVNRHTIKWLEVFFDSGQAIIKMPQRNLGLLQSVLNLIKFDKSLHQNNIQKKQWLQKLPTKPEKLIAEVLIYLGIPLQSQQQFLTLMLTTLPGWAAYIKYYTDWSDINNDPTAYYVTSSEYLALRLVFVGILWPEARTLLKWHNQTLQQANIKDLYSKINKHETDYQKELIAKLNNNKKSKNIDHKQTTAQLIFCIDTRSESFRRALELQGNYETYGFAGFFGIPIKVTDTVTDYSKKSCPVLLKPQYNINENPKASSYEFYKNNFKKLQTIKKIYKSLKYTFITPFSLVETIGFISGIWMGLKCFNPKIASFIYSTFKSFISPSYTLQTELKNIPFEKQVIFATNALKAIGLTEKFAPIIVFCAHGSSTQNNAYASFLDCGACGGNNGSPNARVIASILNSGKVRTELKKQLIFIPKNTIFLAAQHNTTTDNVTIFDINHINFATNLSQINQLKQDLVQSKKQNNLWRAASMGLPTKKLSKINKAIAIRSIDWSQVRPEWGLASNASFIIGPRWLTKAINLNSRSFLHSYKWEQDKVGSVLTNILTAPMIVAQWINSQYLFSSIDNVAFGSGSKITQNIIGKIGIMQGNASDLMHGLPLQSVYSSDNTPYHQPVRLTVIIYAPKAKIVPIIKQHAILQKLFCNQWIHLICYDPKTIEFFKLQKNLTWIKYVL